MTEESLSSPCSDVIIIINNVVILWCYFKDSWFLASFPIVVIFWVFVEKNYEKRENP